MCTHSKSNATQQNGILSLEILFRAVVISSCTYGLSAISNQLCEENYEFLDVVQGRLVKLWFGVYKFASTSSFVSAVEWEKASDLVRTSHQTHRALGPRFCVNLHNAMSNFSTGITRRNIGLCFVNPDSVTHQLKGMLFM